MKNKNIWIFAGIMAILVIAVFALSSGHRSADNRPVVRIGVSLPLTGNNAFIGVPVREAAKMALEDWQKKDTRFRYELIFEDDGFDQKKVAMIGNKFINIDKVNAIMGIWTLTLHQFRELAHKHDIPFFACGWGHDSSDGELVFNNQTPLSETSRVFADIIKNKYRAKNTVLVGMISGGDFAMHDYIEAEFKKNNINIILRETVQYGTTDYGIMIQKIKQKKPEVIIAVMPPYELSIFTKRLKETGLDIPITNVADYFEFAPNKEVYDGMYVVISSNGTDDFKKRFTERTKKPFPSYDCVAPGYDNISILIHAFENADAEPGQIPTTEKVVKQIHGIKNWNGATMENMHVQPDGQIFSPAYIGIMKNGKAEIIKE
ncbi:MAG: ABC transporter substrate-binding protein [Alphaproteobacteria bacterium]|nr:ABC transporter substrate-binding protein [Alphaproteobacteria bacterium]